MKSIMSLRYLAAVGFLSLLLISSSAWAISYHVSLDVSSLVGNDWELEIDLYDNSGTIGDSYALIDNLFFGTVSEDFETGDIGSFDDSLNPDSVDAVLGNIGGTGSYVLRIDEDPAFNPTITWRDFAGSAATTLLFDFQFFGDTGGTDELVFSLLDPATLDPILPGLTPGFGDILAVRSGSMDYTNDVTVTSDVVPEPVTILGVCLGFGGLAHYLRKRYLT